MGLIIPRLWVRSPPAPPPGCEVPVELWSIVDTTGDLWSIFHLRRGRSTTKRLTAKANAYNHCYMAQTMASQEIKMTDTARSTRWWLTTDDQSIVVDASAEHV